MAPLESLTTSDRLSLPSEPALHRSLFHRVLRPGEAVTFYMWQSHGNFWFGPLRDEVQWNKKRTGHIPDSRDGLEI